jgi:hypothetical protein
MSAHFATLESKLTAFSSSRAMGEQASVLDFAMITFPVQKMPSLVCLYVCGTFAEKDITFSSSQINVYTVRLQWY